MAACQPASTWTRTRSARGWTIYKKNNRIIVIDPQEQWVIHQDIFQELIDKAIEILTSFHLRFPLKAGMSREELKVRLWPDLDSRLYGQILSTLLDQGKIVVQEKNLRLSAHQITLSPARGRAKEQNLADVSQAGYEPPNLEDVMQSVESGQRLQGRCIQADSLPIGRGPFGKADGGAFASPRNPVTGPSETGGLFPASAGYHRTCIQGLIWIFQEVCHFPA